MNKIVKRVSLGIVVYMAFAALVILYFPDKPDNMKWEDREEYNSMKIATLKLGATHSAILELLGSPDISEAKMVAKDKLQVMFYRTQRKTADGFTSQDECTPLLFKNDVLIALGKNAYTQFQDS
ncbi:DUF3192 domain-containing protein [Paraneptunicella aestuarii]|uniref:DUF3192 domain-containing protein n=1 Tax=Paraneptunicella aestuarii TaxID=2831148 RepID=UPI001E3A2B75|nr:DUF3192 domain-containing protein [Paraneptunicella aestuarii]UAA39692.1 DUF3192 domain-containing protein [Paraneptunicella aestuarii]